jgi:hypothetical protein
LLLGTLDGIDIGGPPVIDPIDVTVGADGTISGGGFIIGSLESFGTVGPNVIVIPPGAAGSHGTSGVIQVNGRVLLRDEGTLAISLAGADSTQQGRLRVVPAHGIDGSATLGGTLRLDFTDGYAPSTGDTFLLLDAASTSGTFTSTEVTGLEPGWQFEIQIVGGTVVLNSLSDGVPTTPAEPGAPTQADLVLHPPAPNPAAGLTTLRYDLPASGRARLAVYDALGREVAVLVDAERPSGRHEVALNVLALPAGIYLLTLDSVTRRATRRLVVSR